MRDKAVEAGGVSAQAEALHRLLAGRRTVHRFLPAGAGDAAALRAAAERAVRAACMAPNHKMTQPWRFHLLGPETAERVCVLNAERAAEDVRREKGAEAARAAFEDKLAKWRAFPGWMVLTCRRSDDALRAREDYAACCCAAQNFMLALWAEGIGSKWSTNGLIREPRLLELLGIDGEREEIVGMFWYGRFADAPRAPERAALAAVVVEHG